MSNQNFPTANYTRLTGTFDTTIPQAEQFFGYVVESGGNNDALKFYDGATLMHSYAGLSSALNTLRQFPATLVSGSGLRVVATSSTIVIVFWL